MHTQQRASAKPSTTTAPAAHNPSVIPPPYLTIDRTKTSPQYDVFLTDSTQSDTMFSNDTIDVGWGPRIDRCRVVNETDK
jgi:hypothetical protein